MKIPTPQYRCPLGRLQPDVQDVDAIKQRGWRDQHILVVNRPTMNVSTGWSANWCARSASASTVQEDDAMADRRNATWTIEDVAARFEEAASTGRRLPPVRVQGYFNCWPAIVRREWETFAADEKVYRPFPPSPDAIDRMLETMRWVQWLEVEQRHLVWMRAKRYGWRDITIRFACDRTTAWRRWQRALQTVADQLNGYVVAG
jgi:hypothetical protein